MPTLSRKPSSRSVLKNLPPAQQDKLGEYLRESVREKDEETGKFRVRGRTLEEAVEFAADKLKIKTNKTSVGDWFPWWSMMKNFQHFGESAESIKDALRGEAIDEDLVAKIGQQFFLSKAAEQGDAKTYGQISNIILRHLELKSAQAAHADKQSLGEKKLAHQHKALLLAKRKLEAAERRVEALEEKNRLAIEAAKKAKAGIKGAKAMSPEQRRELMKQMDNILGLAPKKGVGA